jgi:hypothetical protein
VGFAPSRLGLAQQVRVADDIGGEDRSAAVIVPGTSALRMPSRMGSSWEMSTSGQGQPFLETCPPSLRQIAQPQWGQRLDLADVVKRGAINRPPSGTAGQCRCLH